MFKNKNKANRGLAIVQREAGEGPSVLQPSEPEEDFDETSSSGSSSTDESQRAAVESDVSNSDESEPAGIREDALVNKGG